MPVAGPSPPSPALQFHILRFSRFTAPATLRGGSDSDAFSFLHFSHSIICPANCPAPLWCYLWSLSPIERMEEEFTMSVEEGLKLAKRVYAGKEWHTAEPPRQPSGMERFKTSLLPKAPMVYAVIVDPAIVDNPDIPSYQPHVYGRCDPPALIPLQMKEITVKADCYFDTVFVRVRGKWRVHCVMGSCCCDCRLLIPLGEGGSILGVVANFARISCATQVVHKEDDLKKDKVLKNEHRSFMDHSFFSLTIPQVDGGCDISLDVGWSQKLQYEDGNLLIKIPFTFPEYVTPFAKIIAKHEKIELNVDTATEKEVIIQKSTHALKEKSRHVGRFSLLYEEDVENWSTKDFEFSYNVFSSDPYGVLYLNSPAVHDLDQRNMFCLYLCAGNNQMGKVFRKEVVFLIDISGSMQGKPLESVKTALLSALQELAPTDYFNIIAFNEEMHFFSSSLEPAHAHILENVTRWISKNMLACGGTDIMHPFNEALGLLSNRKDSVPYIFLVTDGSVENERVVCRTAELQAEKKGSMSPRICTFGIGSYCNHYFLQALSSVGRGNYSAAYYQGFIESEMQKWFRRALLPVLTNITVDAFDKLESVEVYPSKIPDLLVEFPMIIFGRYVGKFPSIVKAEGRSVNMKEVVINLKVQYSMEIPIEKVVAKKYIDLLTAHAWFLDSKQLEDKAAKLSIQLGIPSEYTNIVLRTEPVEKDWVKKNDEKKRSRAKGEATTLVPHAQLGFGDLIATMENFPACSVGPRQPDTSAAIEKAVGRCTGLCDCCCCMCCIQTCSKMNDQCVIVLTQLCTALSCFACAECCINLCCDDG